MTPDSPHRPDGNDPIAEDTPCLVCGYNLRGLPRSGTCPECGAAVEAETLRRRLDLADPCWVCHLSDGAASLTISGLTAGMMGTLGLIQVALALASGQRGTASSPTVLFLFGAQVFLALLLLPSGAIGIYHLTWPEPGGPARATRYRAALRFLLAAAPVCILVGVGWLAVASRTLAIQDWPAVALCGAGGVLALPVIPLLLYAHLAALLRRIAGPDFTAGLRWLRIGTIALAVALVPPPLIALLRPVSPPSEPYFAPLVVLPFLIQALCGWGAAGLFRQARDTFADAALRDPEQETG